jgi:energy-coupling factor transporter ATP-binding protein EcfA2
MIERKLLPIHGAGVKIRMNGRVKNLFLLGDSGAGKSETLETIRSLYGDDYQVDTIFDDMGTFHLLDGKVYASGTEIGAFVRLDDLDQGYSLRSADRAVYLNIDEANSRVVIPIEDFEMTYTLHPVDCLLLADNYTDNQKGITLYSNPQEAMADFIAGKRMAMNTTSEKGLVSTFFANPFGPMQKEKEVRTFLPDYFNALFKNNVPVGKIYTRLSLDRKEGPVNGAKSLIELFKNL